MYSPINPEAYLRLHADETRRIVQRAKFQANQRRARANDRRRAAGSPS